MLTTKHLLKRFKEVYKTNATHTYFSPGRVNLIGEHIDYHGGLVLPAAISIGTYVAAAARSDDTIRIYSHGYTTTPHSFTLNELEKDNENTWINYAKGVFSVLRSEGYSLVNGINLYIESDMPTSGGLSSSSSLELLLIKLLSDVNKFTISKTQMAILGRKVENEYIGVLSGIMDQLVIAHVKKDHALLLNTNTLKFDYIPLMLGDYHLLVVNSNKRRGLADSKYNERYNETMAALKVLQQDFNVNVLVELKSSDLPLIKQKLSTKDYRRVRHVISEQERTLNSAKALKDGDIKAFANFMNASHDSLRDDYEVTGRELDTLVDLMRQNGAIGARMTGAGFGGCAIALAPKNVVPALISQVTHDYAQKIGYEPTFYNIMTSDGTHRLK